MKTDTNIVGNCNARKCVLCRILALCIIAVCKSAEEEYDYEEEAAAPVTPAPTKPAAGRLGGLLSSRGRINTANVGKKKPVSPSTFIVMYNIVIVQQYKVQSKSRKLKKNSIS